MVDPVAVRFLLVLSLLAMALLAGCSAPPQDPPAAGPQGDAGLTVDPLAVGLLGTTRVPYDFGFMLADAPNGVPPQYPVQVRGELTVPDAAGPFPLVLFMHGRHGTCDVAGIEVLGAYVCPNAVVVTPVDSDQGYAPVADLLASHGYVVASIDANDINERDQGTSVGGADYGAMARGRLALETIRHISDANADGGAGQPEQAHPLLQGRVDLSRIGLMGHSRGGEGMARAVVLNHEAAQPVAIRSLFALAPTDFAHWEPTGVTFATLLPYCDGDVSNLHGAWMYDDLRGLEGAGTLHQVLAMGSNHNFYNDRWTGDDWGERDDHWCDRPGGDGRDEPAQQMTQGAAVMTSFFRMTVGDEAGFAAYWTGAQPFPTAACGGACADRLLMSRHASGGQAVVLAADGSGAVSGGAKAALCLLGSASADEDCRAGTIGTAGRTNLTWSSDGGLAFDVPADLPEGLDALTFRIAVHSATAPGATLQFLASDGTVLASQALAGRPFDPAPGDAAKKLVPSMVRLPLEGVDLDRVGVVALRFTGAGEAQLADVMLQDEDPLVV